MQPNNKQSEQSLLIQQQVQSSDIVIVTGYSGAGKNSVLRALEDNGFLCIDNLPIALLHSLFRLLTQSKLPQQRLGLGLDIRGERNIQKLIAELYRIRDEWGVSLQLVFVTSSPGVLFKRFQETRRAHPLAESVDLHNAIEQERELLEPLLAIAQMVVDTDQLTIHQLRALVKTLFQSDTQKNMMVTLTSFGFKYGFATESDLIFDVRFLPNPYFIPELKTCTGLDSRVIDYLFGQKEVQDYWQKLRDFLYYSLERSAQEGRLFTTVAIGCTGGKHRSVALVHKLAQEKINGISYIIKHRDVHRDHYE